jgi:hypothetical protein
MKAPAWMEVLPRTIVHTTKDYRSRSIRPLYPSCVYLGWLALLTLGQVANGLILASDGV